MKDKEKYLFEIVKRVLEWVEVEASQEVIAEFVMLELLEIE